MPIHLLQGWRFQHAPSVPFRKFDEEVLRTLRGLRPHPVRAGSPGPPGRDGPLPLALDPERTRGALRRDWTTRPLTQPSVAERPSAPCTALRAARCGASVATGGSARGGSQGGGGPSAPRLLQNLTPPPARLPPGCSAPTKLDSQLALPWRTGWASGRRGARERASNSAGVRYPRAEWILLCMYTCSMKCPICARAS